MPVKNVIFAPDGRILGNEGAERIELPAEMMEWFPQMFDFCRYQKIGLHCSICKADIIGGNGPNAKIFAVTCGCREWIGGNRDYVEPTQH